jgi:hypothetical protein
MIATPIEVTQHHLNLTGQNVLTFVSWALTIILLAVTIEMGRRKRFPFYVLIVLTAMAGAFAEALYDEAFSLYFYSTHGMRTFYTAFDVPQPVWTHSGYAVLYALPAVLITYRIRRGLLTPRALYAWAGVEFLSARPDQKPPAPGPARRAPAVQRLVRTAVQRLRSGWRSSPGVGLSGSCPWRSWAAR